MVVENRYNRYKLHPEQGGVVVGPKGFSVCCGNDVEGRKIADELNRLAEDLTAVKIRCMMDHHKWEQLLGKELGFPRFRDDPENYPDWDPDDDAVCTYGHPIGELVQMAAEKLAQGLTDEEIEAGTTAVQRDQIMRVGTPVASFRQGVRECREKQKVEA